MKRFQSYLEKIRVSGTDFNLTSTAIQNGHSRPGKYNVADPQQFARLYADAINNGYKGYFSTPIKKDSIFMFHVEVDDLESHNIPVLREAVSKVLREHWSKNNVPSAIIQQNDKINNRFHIFYPNLNVSKKTAVAVISKVISRNPELFQTALDQTYSGLRLPYASKYDKTINDYTSYSPRGQISAENVLKFIAVPFSETLAETPLETPFPERRARPQRTPHLQQPCDIAKLRTHLDRLALDRFVNYTDWRDVCFIIYNETDGSDEGLALFHEYSAKAGSDYDADSCDKLWDSARPDGGLNLGTLIRRACEDSGPLLPQLSTQLQRHAQTFSLDDNYCFGMLVQEIKTSKPFATLHDAIQWLLSKIVRVVARITNSKDIIIIKDSFLNPFSRTLTQRFLNNYGYLAVKDCEGNKCALKTIIRNYDVCDYHDVICRPYHRHQADEWAVVKKDEQRFFNMFLPFAAIQVDEYDMDVVQPILDHIRDVWAAGNKTHYNYLVSWLATIVQRPWEKSGIAIVLKSKQGTGKNILIDFICEYLFGIHLCHFADSIASIVGNFNSFLAGKILININEASTPYGDYHKFFDQMKNQISGKWIAINQKFMDEINMRDYGNYILTTNNSWSVKVEETDRRYAIFECSDCRIGDYAYFDRLGSVLTAETANHLYTFLMNWEPVDIKKIPATEIRKAMILSSLPKPVTFIQEVKSGEVDLSGMWLRDRMIKKDVLFGAFVDWCKMNGYKQCGNSAFGRDIAEYVTYSHPRVNGRQVTAYVLK